MFDPLDQSLDVEWLHANGWMSYQAEVQKLVAMLNQMDATIDPDDISDEILAIDQTDKIKQALQELLQLKEDLKGLMQ